MKESDKESGNEDLKLEAEGPDKENNSLSALNKIVGFLNNTENGKEIMELCSKSIRGPVSNAGTIPVVKNDGDNEIGNNFNSEDKNTIERLNLYQDGKIENNSLTLDDVLSFRVRLLSSIIAELGKQPGNEDEIILENEEKLIIEENEEKIDNEDEIIFKNKDGLENIGINTNKKDIPNKADIQTVKQLLSESLPAEEKDMEEEAEDEDNVNKEDLQKSLNKLKVPTELEQFIISKLVESVDNTKWNDLRLEEFKFDGNKNDNENKNENKNENENENENDIEKNENENDNEKEKENDNNSNIKIEIIETKIIENDVSDKNKSKGNKNVKLDCFLKICVIMNRMLNNQSSLSNDAEKNFKDLTNDFKDFFEKIANIKNIGGYFKNINNVESEDPEFKSFQKYLEDNNLKIEILNNKFNVTKKVKKVNMDEREIECTKLKGRRRQQGRQRKGILFKFLWTLFILGVVLVVLFAINNFVFTFWAVAAATKTAAISSIGIPGLVAVLCFAILKILFGKTDKTEEPGGNVRKKSKLEEEEVEEKSKSEEEEVEEKSKSEEEEEVEEKPKSKKEEDQIIFTVNLAYNFKNKEGNENKSKNIENDKISDKPKEKEKNNGAVGKNDPIKRLRKDMDNSSVKSAHSHLSDNSSVKSAHSHLSDNSSVKSAHSYLSGPSMEKKQISELKEQLLGDYSSNKPEVKNIITIKTEK